MPLRKGKSRETISENIRTEMHEYDRKGKIGTSHPSSRKKAQKQAVAIALSKARQSGAKIPEKRASIILEKFAAELQLRVQAEKVKYPKVHTALSVLGGTIAGAAAGAIPGVLANHHLLTAGGMAAGAVTGGVLSGMSTHKKIKNWNAFIDKLEKHEKKADENKVVENIRKDLKEHEKSDVVQEKKTNKYLGKLVKMEEKEHEKDAAHYQVKPTDDMQHYDKIKSVSLNHREMKRYNKISDKHIYDNATKNVLGGMAIGTAVGVGAGHLYNKSKIGRKYALSGKLLGGYLGGVTGMGLGAARVEGQAHEKALKKTTGYKDWARRFDNNLRKHAADNKIIEDDKKVVKPYSKFFVRQKLRGT